MKNYPSLKAIYRAYLNEQMQNLGTKQPAVLHQKYIAALNALGATCSQDEHFDPSHFVSLTHWVKGKEAIKTLIKEPYRTGGPLTLTIQYLRNNKIIHGQTFNMAVHHSTASEEVAEPLKGIYTAYTQGIKEVKREGQYNEMAANFFTEMLKLSARPTFSPVRSNSLSGHVYRFALGREAIEVTNYQTHNPEGKHCQKIQYYRDGGVQATKALSSLWNPDGKSDHLITTELVETQP